MKGFTGCLILLLACSVGSVTATETADAETADADIAETGMTETGMACGTPRAPGAISAEGVLTVPLESESSWEKESYYHGLLRRVLAATEAEYGPCRIQTAPRILTRSRTTLAISHGQGVDVLWANTTREREAQMQAVHIPLMKGLMSYKVALIHRDNQARFDQIHNLEQLTQLRAGAGQDWPDTQILQTNGFHVEGSSNYDALFRMLAAGRFDLMLRSVSEIDAELAALPELPLKAEDNLLLVFPSPVYFFVNNGQAGLAQRLKLGLERIMADGSFDAYFYLYPVTANALSYLRHPGRRVLYLQNPLLPGNAPLDRPEFWLVPWEQHPEHGWVMGREQEVLE